jgi:hypothetical protein
MASSLVRQDVGPYEIAKNDCVTYASDVLGKADVASSGVTPGLNFGSVALQSPAAVAPLHTAAAVSATVSAAITTTEAEDAAQVCDPSLSESAQGQSTQACQ